MVQKKYYTIWMMCVILVAGMLGRISFAQEEETPPEFAQTEEIQAPLTFEEEAVQTQTDPVVEDVMPDDSFVAQQSMSSQGQQSSSVNDQGRISLDIKGMDIVDVLKMLATKANMNVVVDKNVSGRVTVFLKNIKPDEAFDVILASNGLVQETNGEIVRIMTDQDYELRHGARPRDPKKTQTIQLKYIKPQDAALVLNQVKSNIGKIITDEGSKTVILVDTQSKNQEMARLLKEMDQPTETRVFQFNYAPADKIGPMVEGMLTKNIGQMKLDSRTNQVIVTDYPATLSRIADAVAIFDERTPEVSIQARILQVSLNEKTTMGIDWEYIFNEKVTVKGMFDQLLTSTGNVWTIGTDVPSEPGDYKVIIEALETKGRTKILSSPRLTVVNNEEAKILVGSKQVYVTTTAVQGQTSTQTAEAVNFVDVGVKLYVTPVVTRDGFISMKIRPEVSSVTENYRSSSGNLIPIVETSEAETKVLLRDGSTVMIGGLMRDEDSKTTDQVPWFGRIPVLGFFFRNKVDTTRKAELAIFLTCKIIRFADSPAS